MNKSWIVYGLTCKVTGKHYIGQTCKPLSTRWGAHLANVRMGKHHPLYNAIRKYGASEFDVRTLKDGLSKAEADAWERALIIFNRTRFNQRGYNIADGGAGNSGTKASAATRAKLSAQRRGKKYGPQSAERRANISKALTGRKNGPLSVEHRAKIAAANRGKKKGPPSREHRDKIAAAHIGVPLSLEHCRRITEGKLRHYASLRKE